MHSLEATASLAGRLFAQSHRSVVDVVDCRISVASQDIIGAVYPEILM